MSRPQKISLYQKDNTWYVRFPKDGKRIKKSCKTKSENTAKNIAKDIGLLFVDPDRIVHPTAYEIFHDEKPILKAKDTNSAVYRQLSKYVNGESEEFILGDLAVKVEKLEESLKQMADEKHFWEAKFKAVTSKLEGKMIAEQENIPTLEEALALYKEDIKHLQRWKRNYFNFINDFFTDTIGIEKKINEVTSLEIRKCLIEDSKNESANPEDRWNRKRQMFTKFFNWATGLWPFLNPCTTIGTKKEEEREDPDWHDITEVYNVIEAQDSVYRKALVETLFFTGMIAKELRGILLTDYFEIDGKWHIRVSPNRCRSIKAGKRRRNIPVVQSLKESLDDYIKNHHPGGEALFPPLVKKGDREFWEEGTFSRYLQNQCKFNQYENMNCQSTRRTYGSIMLRLGFNYAEVASLMGNSVRMVEKHYARIEANEVDMSKFMSKLTKLIKKSTKEKEKKEAGP